MPNSEPGHEQPKITVLFGPFSANEEVAGAKGLALAGARRALLGGVADQLRRGADDAALFSRVVLRYFERLSGRRCATRDADAVPGPSPLQLLAA